MNNLYRPMGGSDLPEVLTIERDSFVSPWTECLFREGLCSPITRSFVAVHDGAILGYAVFYLVKDEAHILNVAVRRESRNNGFGMYLMMNLIASSRNEGVKFFFLEVRESNSAARHLYRKLGFVMVGRRKNYYQETKEDAIVMSLVSEWLLRDDDEARPAHLRVQDGEIV